MLRKDLSPVDQSSGGVVERDGYHYVSPYKNHCKIRTPVLMFLVMVEGWKIQNREVEVRV